MKRLFLLSTITTSVCLAFVLCVSNLVKAGQIDKTELRAYYTFAGIKYNDKNVDVIANEEYGGEDVVNEPSSQNSYFSSISAYNNDLTSQVFTSRPQNVDLYYSGTDFSTSIVDSDMIYHNTLREMPLAPTDWYYQKYTNAVAGVRQINLVPILHSGDTISLINDGYINIKSFAGYVRPPHYVFGSGLCWSTSALGAMLDDANIAFRNKYGMDLVVYSPGDRAPHGGYYLTYTNGHRGYTVLQSQSGRAVQDYRFTVNPRIKLIPGLEDFKMKIVMIYSNTHPSASNGESIGAYIISNKEF